VLGSGAGGRQCEDSAEQPGDADASSLPPSHPGGHGDTVAACGTLTG
jgi:hypothetical protein